MKLPWFSMYPTDFLVSTASLTPVQGWAYTQLLMYIWSNGNIPDDHEACARMTRCDLSAQDWAVLRSRFVEAGDKILTHPRLEKERDEASARSGKAQERAKAAASKRWSKPEAPDKQCSEHATSMPSTTTTTTTDTPLPPTDKATVTDRGGGVTKVKWSPTTDQVDRLARSNPTVATRIERARSGDLWARDEKGNRRQVSADEVLSDARTIAQKAIGDELEAVLRDLCEKGLSPREATALWRVWFANWVKTGTKPRAAMAAELADKSIRNHVAVWKKRAAGGDATG
jgi:uncharacterized protein YdaU (DUF1376 family)